MDKPGNVAENKPEDNSIKCLCKEKLLSLDKNELADKIMKLNSQNLQLMNFINQKAITIKKLSKSRKKQARPFDFSRCHYRKLLLHILYFGWDYQGLAVQDDTTQTIEYHLFQALQKACLIENREMSNYHRCGRTDKGVSSFGQVISISLRSKFPVEQQNAPENIVNELPYCKTLNRLLPKNIRAVTWRPIPLDKPEFSARFDCKKRQYKYYFPHCVLDIQAMRSACTHLVGSHDYRNLCKMDVGNGVTEFRRNILKAEILPVNDADAHEPTSMYYLLIEGNAFLWHQIRCIMGVLLLVGQGKEKPEVVAELLDIKKNPRKPQYNMALDIPLNLFQCFYDLQNSWVYDKHDLATIITQLQREWTIRNIQSTMMKDVLSVLETQYALLGVKREPGTAAESDKDKIIAYSDCLIQGVKPKIYIPLMKRGTCSSLAERMEYYAKKRKIENPQYTAKGQPSNTGEEH